MASIHLKSMSRFKAITFTILALSSTCHATEDVESPQQRILELERQMQFMAEQLKAVQAQLAQSKDTQTPAIQKTSGGSPVEASFKNGLVLRDATGDWSLRLYARTQVDYRHFSPDAFAADTFSLRRARLGTIATFFDDFSMRLEAEYSDSNAKLNDAWLDYTHFKSAMLRVGQFYTMHGIERAQGAMDINFMERGFSDQVLGSVYDRGAMLHGAPINGLFYNLTYMNGTGQNTDESPTNTKQDSKDWSLRVVGNLAQWAGWQNSVVHFGGMYIDGMQAAGSAIPTIRTEARGTTLFSTTNNNTFNSSVDRTITGLETALAYGPVKFQSEYVKANFEGADFSKDMSAWYASLQWLVTGEDYASLYKYGTFAGISPKNSFRYGTQNGWGALELGARYSHFDASDFSNMLANKDQYTNGADAWTLGIKWLLNDYAQLQLNYVHTSLDTAITRYGKTDDNEDAINMRMHYNF